jgi:hypothetical protein
MQRFQNSLIITEKNLTLHFLKFALAMSSFSSENEEKEPWERVNLRRRRFIADLCDKLNAERGRVSSSD